MPEVSLLFTDIEGSTRLWDLFPEAMERALRRHDEIVRSALEGQGGTVFATAGDSFAAAFPAPLAAVRAAVAIQRALRVERWPPSVPIRVRVGIHTGVCARSGATYVGSEVNRAARLHALGHGGQTVLSRRTREMIGDEPSPGLRLRCLGVHPLRDLVLPETVFQLCVPGLPEWFPPLRASAAPGGERRAVGLTAAIARSRMFAMRHSPARTSVAARSPARAAPSMQPVQ
jgi:class 3 adenylate cyclase